MSFPPLALGSVCSFCGSLRYKVRSVILGFSSGKHLQLEMSPLALVSLDPIGFHLACVRFSFGLKYFLISPAISSLIC